MGALSKAAQERENLDALAPEIESPAAEQYDHDNDEEEGVGAHWVNLLYAVVSLERVAAAEVGCLFVFAQFVGQSPTEYRSSFGRYSTSVVDDPALAGRQRLALIQRLWCELQAARKDLAKYEAIAERIRREADVFLQTLEAAKSVGAKVVREPRGAGALKRNGS
jgi:hypothetical protein